MNTQKMMRGYIIFEVAALVVFGYLLTPAQGAGAFLIGPRTGLAAAVAALFFNPIIGILGLCVAGSELFRKNRSALVIVLLVLSLAFATLFPAVRIERGIAAVFSHLLAR